MNLQRAREYGESQISLNGNFIIISHLLLLLLFLLSLFVSTEVQILTHSQVLTIKKKLQM